MLLTAIVIEKEASFGRLFWVLVEAAGIIRPSSLPLQSHRSCVPALSRHCVARLNPLRVFIPKSTANKKPQPFRVEVLLGGGGVGNFTEPVGN